MSGEKRSRGINFTTREKSLLLDIISKYKNVIENKQSDAVSWKDKQLTWDKICNQFNAMLPENAYRTKESLKKFYENVKKKVRKDVADEKLEICKTGGGIIKKINDPVYERALDLMNPKTVTGLLNPFDGDSENMVCSTIQSVPSTSTSRFGETPKRMRPEIEHFSDKQNIEFIYDMDNKSPQSTSMCQETSHCDEKGNAVKEKVHEEDWGNVTPGTHLRKPTAPVLANNNRWSNRRRPALKSLSSSKLTEEYSKLGALKNEVWNFEKETKIIERQQKQELFELQKKNLLLDNELKELQIKKMKYEMKL